MNEIYIEAKDSDWQTILPDGTQGISYYIDASGDPTDNSGSAVLEILALRATHGYLLTQTHNYRVPKPASYPVLEKGLLLDLSGLYKECANGTKYELSYEELKRGAHEPFKIFYAVTPNSMFVEWLASKEKIVSFYPLDKTAGFSIPVGSLSGEDYAVAGTRSPVHTAISLTGNELVCAYLLNPPLEKGDWVFHDHISPEALSNIREKAITAEKIVKHQTIAQTAIKPQLN